MLLKTSTLSAPWTIVEADDASWAQVKVLRTVAEALSRELSPASEGQTAEPDETSEREVTTPAQPRRDEGGKKGKPKGP